MYALPSGRDTVSDGTAPWSDGPSSPMPGEEGAYPPQRESLPAVSMAARPASRRATGIRKGEQET